MLRISKLQCEFVDGKIDEPDNTYRPHSFTFKVGLSPSNFFICFNDRPLQMMNNAFYFILIALFVLRYLNFCLEFLVM